MPEIIIHDKRRGELAASNGPVVFTVEPQTGLDEILTLVAFFCDTHRDFRKIVVMADESDGRRRLGRDRLDVENVRQWSILKGRAREIVFRSVAPAEAKTAPQKREAEIFFCSRLAFYSGATVTTVTAGKATTTGRFFNRKSARCPAATVMVFRPDGKITLPDDFGAFPGWLNPDFGQCPAG